MSQKKNASAKTHELQAKEQARSLKLAMLCFTGLQVAAWLSELVNNSYGLALLHIVPAVALLGFHYAAHKNRNLQVLYTSLVIASVLHFGSLSITTAASGYNLGNSTSFLISLYFLAYASRSFPLFVGMYTPALVALGVASYAPSLVSAPSSLPYASQFWSAALVSLPALYLSYYFVQFYRRHVTFESILLAEKSYLCDLSSKMSDRIESIRGFESVLDELDESDRALLRSCKSLARIEKELAFKIDQTKSNSNQAALFLEDLEHWERSFTDHADSISETAPYANCPCELCLLSFEAETPFLQSG